MIDITSRDKDLMVVINTETGVLKQHLWCAFGTSDEVIARILARDLQGRLDKLVEGIRKDAYTAGYRNGRKKVKQKTSFSHNLRLFPSSGGCW